MVPETYNVCESNIQRVKAWRLLLQTDRGSLWLASATNFECLPFRRHRWSSPGCIRQRLVCAAMQHCNIAIRNAMPGYKPTIITSAAGFTPSLPTHVRPEQRKETPLQNFSRRGVLCCTRIRDSPFLAKEDSPLLEPATAARAHRSNARAWNDSKPET